MFFPDKVAGLREARRVLRPGGRLLFNVWDRIEENRFTDIVVQEASRMFPENPPNFLARTPHGYHDVRRIEADVREAGFQDVSITTVTERSTAESARDVAIAFCQGTPMRVELEALGPQALKAMTDAADKALVSAFGDGEISGTIQAHVVVAGG
jgi:SAM-dependent methyltransferase